MPRPLLLFILLLPVLILLPLLAGCVAGTNPNPTAVRSQDWPQDSLPGRRYHAFRPMGSFENALRALRELGPQLSAEIPETDEGHVSSVDADDQRVVFGWQWWEDQPVRTYPFYRPLCPPGSLSLTCDDWDYPTVPSRRVRRQAKGAVLYRDIADIRLDTSDSVLVLQSSGAPMSLSAPSGHVANMIADAFYTLARAAGREIVTPTGIVAADLSPRQASVLRLTGGVMLTGVMPGSPAHAAGLRRLDVVVLLDGLLPSAAQLPTALAAPGEHLVEALRFPLEAKAGNMAPTPLRVVVHTPHATP